MRSEQNRTEKDEAKSLCTTNRDYRLQLSTQLGTNPYYNDSGTRLDNTTGLKSVTKYPVTGTLTGSVTDRM